MRKHNQVHTLGASHYKVHFRFLKKEKDFECALWSENTIVALICSQAIICLPCTQKSVCGRMGVARGAKGATPPQIFRKYIHFVL